MIKLSENISEFTCRSSRHSELVDLLKLVLLMHRVFVVRTRMKQLSGTNGIHQNQDLLLSVDKPAER